MIDHGLFMTFQAAVSAVCWLIVAGAAGLAVFATRIHDTVLERLALSAVSITALASAFRIGIVGWVSDGSAAMSYALALYAVAATVKNVRGAENKRGCHENKRFF